MDDAIALRYVRSMPVYEPGKPISETAREFGLNEDDIIKLASNENPIGVSGQVIDALIMALKEVSRYPDGNGFALRQALAQHHQISAEHILLGNGSNDILELVGMMCLAPGYSAIFSEYAFAVYALMTHARGAEAICVPSRDFGHDLDAMANAITETTKVVLIANPNNPTGTYLNEESLRAFLKRVPSHVLVVLDEAYHDFLDPEDRFNTIEWLNEFDNLLISRTFSKAYGLAGLRIGYAVGHPTVIDLLNRVRQPFNTNSLAQVAAIAALGDKDFLRRSYEVNKLGLVQVCEGLKTLGLDYIPSKANFVTFKIDQASVVFEELLKAGVIVRPLGSYGLPDFLRVSIGLQTENDKFLQVLGNIVKRRDGTAD